MLKFFSPLIIITVLFIAPRQSVAAEDCSPCQLLDRQYVFKSKLQRLLKKNEEMLAKKKDVTSIRVKLRSNLVIIKIKLEATKNEIKATKIKLKEGMCLQCPPEEKTES